MFQKEITRWQRTQKQMKSAQAAYDNMSPSEPPSDEEIEEMRRKHDAEQEWLIARMENERTS